MQNIEIHYHYWKAIEEVLEDKGRISIKDLKRLYLQDGTLYRKIIHAILEEDKEAYIYTVINNRLCSDVLILDGEQKVKRVFFMPFLSESKKVTYYISGIKNKPEAIAEVEDETANKLLALESEMINQMYQARYIKNWESEEVKKRIKEMQNTFYKYQYCMFFEVFMGEEIIGSIERFALHFNYQIVKTKIACSEHSIRLNDFLNKKNFIPPNEKDIINHWILEKKGLKRVEEGIPTYKRMEETDYLKLAKVKTELIEKELEETTTNGLITNFTINDYLTPEFGTVDIYGVLREEGIIDHTNEVIDPRKYPKEFFRGVLDELKGDIIKAKLKEVEGKFYLSIGYSEYKVTPNAKSSKHGKKSSFELGKEFVKEHIKKIT
ncbi:hypothetical protein AAG747_06530 [Rapidithrix thailandica]|uniref:Uncharacterized protein n=1 Tax=Rapidithrix thailandica TaxID=413964 RepID=A0AAW9S141_9BACT